jgi:hypothetical protein
MTASELASRLITPKRRAAAKTSGSHFVVCLATDLYLDMTDRLLTTPLSC